MKQKEPCSYVIMPSFKGLCLWLFQNPNHVLHYFVCGVCMCIYIGLEVNADKTKYMVMSRDQNAGRSHSMKIDSSSFERLGTTLTNQNSIQEEIRSRLKLGIACYHSVQNLLLLSLLSKNLKIKIY
jgi:hypothetical protein